VGKFIRQLSVGSDVDVAGIKAAFEDGVLAVTLPKKPAATEKSVKISVE
jgi:HSP20 family protein